MGEDNTLFVKNEHHESKGLKVPDKKELLNLIFNYTEFIYVVLISNKYDKNVGILGITNKNYFGETEVPAFWDKYVRINIVLKDGTELKLRVESHDFAEVFMKEFQAYIKNNDIEKEFYENKIKFIKEKDEVSSFINDFIKTIFDKEKGGYDIVIHC